MTAEEYVKQQLAEGKLSPRHIVSLVLDYQDTYNSVLKVDGKPGPSTIEHLEKNPTVNKLRDALAAGTAVESAGRPLVISDDGLLSGDGVTVIAAHGSWFGGELEGGPGGVVCHVSDTAPGTALNMAKRRARPFGADPDDRLASWHASVETDGTIVQMISFRRLAFHAGSKTAKKVPGLGWANQRTVGIELVGRESGPFPEAQILGYARVLRALRLKYGITREFAMITHASIDPTRRSDPGQEWITKHAQRVLDLAFAA